MDLDEAGVPFTHHAQSIRNVRVQFLDLVGVEEREEFVDECLAACHPLVVVAAGMGVRPIQTTSREPLHKPVKDALMTDVHPQHDLGLAPIASERSLTDEQTDEKPPVEFGKLDHEPMSTATVFHRQEKRETRDRP